MIGSPPPTNGAQRHRARRRAASASAAQPQPSGARRAVQAPQHAGQRDEPDQHRQVHVHDERDMKEVGDRQQPVEPGRARQHQQDREQARSRSGPRRPSQSQPRASAACAPRGTASCRPLAAPARGACARGRPEDRWRGVHCQDDAALLGVEIDDEDCAPARAHGGRRAGSRTRPAGAVLQADGDPVLAGGDLDRW